MNLINLENAYRIVNLLEDANADREPGQEALQLCTFCEEFVVHRCYCTEDD